MKKILFIFIFGQLLILSFIFNQNVYPIFELNHLGEDSLESYKVNKANGSELGELYQRLEEACFQYEKCDVQIIKMPISENNTLIYDVYHSNVAKLHKIKSISKDKVFRYHALSKEEFIDSTGVFYTDLEKDKLKEISDHLGMVIEPHPMEIEYTEVLKFNFLNIIILLILSQLIFFIYTFTRIKINAIKKLLGFSNLKMVTAVVKQLLWIQLIIISIITVIHLVYYINANQIVPRYFYMLVLFLIFFCFLNLILQLITQISIKYIDINLMLKNKFYSNRLNVSLYVIKVLLMLAITFSVSILILNYKEYKEKLRNYDEFSNLSNYYTSVGYNADEYTQAMEDTALLLNYGKSVKTVYHHFDSLNQLYVHDATAVLSKLSPISLERKGLTSEDIMADFKVNYMVVNKTYLQDFIDVKDPKGEPIRLNMDQPTILVPEKFKTYEQEIQNEYTKLYNTFLNYNAYYKAGNAEKRSIDQIDIIYLSDNYKLEMFGKMENKGLSEIELTNTILMIDLGEFDSLYYLDQLNHGDLIVKAKDRNEFSEQLQAANLSNLVNVGTLVTPFLNKIRNTEFIMYHSLVFSVLFLITLIFVIYISNYVAVTSNGKKMAYKYAFGYHLFRTLKGHLFLNLTLIFVALVTFLLPFNLTLYFSILILDMVILILLYKTMIVRNIYKIVKGG